MSRQVADGNDLGAARVQDLDWTRNAVLATRAALQNRAYTDGVATMATLTAPTAGIFAVLLLTAKVSGLFMVSASGYMQVGAPEAGGASISLESQTPATAGVGINISNGTASGTGVQVSSATTAITIAAASGSLSAAQNHAQATGLNGLASSALVAPFSFSGILGSVVGGQPLAKGSTIAYYLAGTVATTTLTINLSNFSAFEMP